MTINQVITQIQNEKPSQYSVDTLVKWLSDVEGLIYHEVVRWHKGTDHIQYKPFNADTDLDKVLFVPEPYSNVYLRYLAAQIDYNNGELPQYANSMTLYNTALTAFADYYNRNNMPKQDHYIKI